MIYRRFFDYPSLGLRSPSSEFERMRRQMDRLFTDWPGQRDPRVSAGVFPQINLTEDAGKFYARAELPGIAANDLEIQATSKTLSITGERKIAKEDEGVRYHRRERDAGKFSRVVSLPTEIDPDKIEAKMENGILTVFIPKAEAAKPRQITIN
ncbi:MAG: Hsp20/alpha crystallin family protein [Desulfobacteraceae bacterium]|nr:Hsp20/alpha crystallin family protein [Desulfobacteraceae bacterium]